jgi:import inner membrane translocase subunit TIM50
MTQPPLSVNELQYNARKPFRTSTTRNRDEKNIYQEDISEFMRETERSRRSISEIEDALPKPRIADGAEPKSEQEEFDGPKAAQVNTTPTEQPGPGRPTQVRTGERDVRTEQEEFASPQSPDVNTTPDTQPTQASEEPSEHPKIQLPDLRQGIPSTFSEEFMKQAEARASEEHARHELDITEERAEEEAASGRGRGGGGEDELPRSAYETSIDKRRNALATYMYIFFGVTGLVGAVYLGRNWENEAEERAHPDAPSGWDLRLFWNRIKARTSQSLGYYTEPTFPKLLPIMDPAPPYTLVLSLEDLMIHSEWTRQHGWRTAKRPGLDYFLRYLSQYYEIVLFTTMSMASADQIIRKLDPYHLIMWPLFREATRYEHGEYIKVRKAFPSP